MTIYLSMSKTIRYALILCLPILFLLHPWNVFSEETIDDALKPDEALEEELKYLSEETYVITPSKIPQRIEKAPGTIHVVTDRQIRQMGARYLMAPGTIHVVTDRQIRQMGARYLMDVVRTVPGWYVWDTWYGEGYPLFL